MKFQFLKLYVLIVLLLTGSATFADTSSAKKTKESWKPDIPRTWVDAAMAELEVPLADPVGSPKHISADYYYRLPVLRIYKSYPIYAPGK